MVLPSSHDLLPGSTHRASHQGVGAGFLDLFPSLELLIFENKQFPFTWGD